MKKTSCLATALIALSASATAQLYLPVESAGLAGQRMFQQSAAGQTFGNACTLDSVGRFSAGIWSSRSFLLAELAAYGAAVRLRLPSAGYFTAGVAQQGFALFRYREITGALGRQFGRKFSGALGLSLTSMLQGEGAGNLHRWWLRPGTMAALSRRVDIAAGCRIPLSGPPDMPAVPEFRIGLRCRFSRLFQVQTEAVLAHRLTGITTTLRYTPFKKVLLDFGVGGKPFGMAMGCRLQTGGLHILLAARYQSLPGLSPAVGAEIAGAEE